MKKKLKMTVIRVLVRLGALFNSLRSNGATLSIFTATTVFVTGCAVNPQTGQPEFAQNILTGFNSIFDSPDPCSNNDRNIGMAIGAIIGGVIGSSKNGKKGALTGALIGTGVGGVIGYMLDSRRCELYKIAQANHLKIASAAITNRKLGNVKGSKQGADTTVGLDVQVKNQDDEFEPGTARLTPRANKYFTSIARQYTPAAMSTKKSDANQTADRKVLIVAHSDESAGSRRSASLTQERAHAVAKVFSSAGVPANNIYYQGAGDTLPIASNGTSNGRNENQRIEIVDVPDESDLKHYLQLRQPNASYFVSAHKQSPGSEIKSVSRTTSNVAGYDFGGKPLAEAGAKPIDLGAPLVHSTFSLIAEAHAETPLEVGSCTGDQPHVASAVRNLATGRELPVRDYMPGFYGAPWLGGFHGNLVVVDKAYVPRDSGSPVPKPKLMIYRYYKGNADAKPSYSASVPVNVYRGEDATLYRMFVDGPVRCIDFVKPKSPGNAQGRLYYSRDGHTYLAEGDFALKN